MPDFKLIPANTRITQSWLVEDANVEAFAPGGDIQEKLLADFPLSVGDRPFARSVRKLYKARKQELPPEIASLKGETYLITHAIGLTAKHSANKVEMVGYSAHFDDPGSTIELFPNTQFKEFFAASTKFQAGISADGYAKLPDQIGALAKEVVNLGAGAELQVGAEAKVVGKLTLTVKTPKIQAVGNASSRVSWQLHKDENPLVGDQVLVQTIVVPKGQEKLTFKMQAFAVISPGLFRRPVRVETEELTVRVDLL
jgi:hypothetical protein